MRSRLGKALVRGTCYATLSAQREATTPEVRINQDLLRRLSFALAELPVSDRLRPASLDGILAVRGVVETREAEDSEEDLAAFRAAALDGFEAAIEALLGMRHQEGEALGQILFARLERLNALRIAADTCPARTPEAIRARLAATLAMLASHANFDQNRLYQEALLLAAKADIREELDRLETHLQAVRDLLNAGARSAASLIFLRPGAGS